MRNKFLIATLVLVLVLGIGVIGACAKRTSADEQSASISAIDAALMQGQ